MTETKVKRPAESPIKSRIDGYLIDPAARTVEPFAYNGDWQTIAPAIDAQLFEVCDFGAGDLFVDEEGLFRGDLTHWIAINGYPQPVAGKGLVFAHDREGNTVSATVTRAELLMNIWFLDLVHRAPAAWLVHAGAGGQVGTCTGGTLPMAPRFQRCPGFPGTP